MNPRKTLAFIAMLGLSLGFAAGNPKHPVLRHRLQHLERQLELTEVQQAQVKGVFANLKTQLQAIRKDSTLSTDGRKAKLQELKSSTQGQISQILTAEQLEKLKKARGK